MIDLEPRECVDSSSKGLDTSDGPDGIVNVGREGVVVKLVAVRDCVTDLIDGFSSCVNKVG